MTLKNVAICVWDFDGTLFHSNDRMFNAVREAELRIIMEHTGWDHERALMEFTKLHNVVTPSGTAVTAMLAKISHKTAALETEKHFDRSRYLTRDEKLTTLFQTLSHFRHMMLTNGIEVNIRKTMLTMGLDSAIFERIVTPEFTRVTKPDPAAFAAVLSYTKLPAKEHLMIGDREAVDLVPAKTLGMRTCLVWSDVKSDIADATVSTVYDVATLLTP